MPLNNINLMGPNPAQPFDIQTQQALLAQQAQIAQALIAQGLKDEPAVIRTAAGNPFGRDIPNFGGPIGNLVQAIYGQQQQRDINQQQAGLANELQRRDALDTADVLRTRQGYMGQGEGPPTAEGELPQQHVPGNFVKAVQMAMSSSVPRVKAWGAKMAESLPSPEDVLKYGKDYDPASMAAFVNDPSNAGVLQPPPKLDISGGVATSYQGGKVLGTQATETFGAPFKNEMDVPVQASNVTGKQHAFGQYGDTSTQKTFDNLDSAAQIKLVEDGVKGYAQNGQNLGAIAQAREELKSIPEDSMGWLGSFKTSFSKAAEALGFDKLESTSSKEAVRSVLGNINLQKVRALAPVTEVDLAEIKKIVGSEDNTKRALVKVMDYLEGVTLREMKQHEERVKVVAQRSSNPAQFYKAYVPDFQTAPMAVSNPVSTMSDEDLRKRLGK